MKLITNQSIISILSIFGIFIISNFSLQAQDKFLHIGTGLLSSSQERFQNYDNRSLPIFIAGESNKITNIFGLTEIDFIRGGFYFNYVKHQYDDTFLGNATLTSIGLGARLSVSPIDVMNEISDKYVETNGFDIYIGTQMGYEIVGVSNGLIGGAVSDYRITPFVGARYLVNDRVGFYAELGRTAHGVLNVGLAIGFGSKK